MARRFRVRFAPALPVGPPKSQHRRAERADGRIALPERSRSGCKNCRKRRVKCDEMFPVCQRCKKRGEVCESEHQPPRWQLEPTGLLLQNINWDSPNQLHLMRYWCETASQIMVLDPETNPFSFPIIEYLEQSPTLMSTILSISAAHKQFFKRDCLETCLEERSRALSLLRGELAGGRQPLPTTFLSIFMLGISTPWIDDSLCQFGYEHLNGAAALIELLLASPVYGESKFTQLAIGAYLYWDMACSFLLEPGHKIPIVSPLIQAAAIGSSGIFHPIVGYSSEIMYWLGKLGRYCRYVIDFGPRDLELERVIERQLLGWQPPCAGAGLAYLGSSFKYHGLINLYRICGRPGDSLESSWMEMDQNLTFPNLETESIIRQYALQTVRTLHQISASNWHTNLQAIPLLTAGSELTADDAHERILVTERLSALYSINRIPGNLMAVDILREVWDARDLGVTFSWLDVMLLRGWRLSLG